jgi:outer membrane protein assembly factor BamD (BamD/ComL family)
MGKYKKYIWMAGLCCALPLTVSGQQVEPLTGADRLFNEGRELFLRQDYAAARQTLVRYTRQAGEKAWADEVDYMLACTAYELKMPDCREVLSDYLEAHPESRYRNRVQALIGASYFSEEKYMETIATLKGCDISLLSDEERDASALRMGTSYLKVGKLQDAAFWFAVLKETSKDFHNDAVYNLAYIDYVQQKYDTALQGFREVQDDRKFQKLAPYYIADIYLIQGNYAQARKVADAYLALYPEEKYAAQMNRISGEAAYGQKDYAAAIQSLERYHEAEEVPARLANPMCR